MQNSKNIQNSEQHLVFEDRQERQMTNQRQDITNLQQCLIHENYQIQFQEKIHIIKIPTIKQTQIELDTRQLVSIQSFNAIKPSKKQNEKRTFFKEQQQINEINQLNKNFFIGSRPGLFKNIKKQLDQNFSIESQSLEKIISIQKLENSQQKIKLQQEINGNTIIDIQTEIDQSIIQENIVDKKTIQKGFTFSSKLRKNRHTNDCINSIQNSNDVSQIIVPGVKITKKYKSKYNQNQYSPVNDKYLTNFFVSKNKQTYVKNFNQYQTQIQSIDKSLVQKRIYQNYKTQRKSLFTGQQINNNNNRISACTNPSANRGSFEKDFKQFNTPSTNRINTKFLVKVTPSEKIKKFFNNSTSTLINHNFRPVTSRPYSINSNKKENIHDQNENILKQINDINSNQRFYKSSKDKFVYKNNSEINHKTEMTTKNKQNKLDCDYWASLNSHRKMNQNSKKGNKIKTSNINSKYQLRGINANINEKFKKQENIFQNHYGNEENNQNHTNNNNFTQKNVFSFQNITNSSKFVNPSNNFNPSAIFNPSSIFNNSTSLKLSEEIYRQNVLADHIKRRNLLQRKVMSKVEIAQKMGVKIPVLVSSPNSFEHSRIKKIIK